MLHSIKQRLFGNKNKEMPNQTPIEIPLGYNKPLTIEEMIALHVRAQDAIKSQGFESFEDANDFNVDEENDPTSSHEVDDMVEEYIDETYKDRDLVKDEKTIDIEELIETEKNKKNGDSEKK